MSGTTIATTLVISTTLQQSYHWAPQNTGLAILSVAVASILTIPITGVLGDYLQKVLAKRPQGHRVSSYPSIAKLRTRPLMSVHRT